MSKPPFVIPTLKGHELWPTITRTPSTVRIQLVLADGMTPEEQSVARLKALSILRNADGLIKQSYLAFRQNADLSNSQFISKTIRIAEGITGRYVQNGPHETLNITVYAAAVLNPSTPVDVRNRPLRGDYVILGPEVPSGIASTVFASPIYSSAMRKGTGYINDPAVHFGAVGPPFNPLVSFPQIMRIDGHHSDIISVVPSLLDGGATAPPQAVVGTYQMIILKPFRDRHVERIFVDVCGFGILNVNSGLVDVGARAALYIGEIDLDQTIGWNAERGQQISVAEDVYSRDIPQQGNGFFPGTNPGEDTVDQLAFLTTLVIDLRLSMVRFIRRSGYKSLSQLHSSLPVYGVD